MPLCLDSFISMAENSATMVPQSGHYRAVMCILVPTFGSMAVSECQEKNAAKKGDFLTLRHNKFRHNIA